MPNSNIYLQNGFFLCIYLINGRKSYIYFLWMRKCYRCRYKVSRITWHLRYAKWESGPNVCEQFSRQIHRAFYIDAISETS